MNETIMIRLLGEPLDCWRPVEAIAQGADRYRIVEGADPDECCEFRVGEVVSCRREGAQWIAVQLAQPITPTDLASPLGLQLDAVSRRRRALAEAVAGAIDAADPAGLLAVGAPSDEYGSEIGAVLAQLPGVRDIEDVAAIVRDEFCRSCGVELGAAERQNVAAAIWEAVEKYRYAV